MIKFKYTNEDKVSTTIETESMDHQELLEDFTKFMKAIGFNTTSITSAMKKYIEDNTEPINLSKPLSPTIKTPYTKGILDELYDKYDDKLVEKYKKANPYDSPIMYQTTGVTDSPVIMATTKYTEDGECDGSITSEVREGSVGPIRLHGNSTISTGSIPASECSIRNDAVILDEMYLYTSKPAYPGAEETR